MKYRCTNKGCRHYHLYGGRGIKVCARWLNSFENFLADMGERPVGKTLDRIDNNGNYEPENCRWATCSEQLRNRRPENKGPCRFIERDGLRLSIKGWAELVGIKPATLQARLANGVDIGTALRTPVRHISPSGNRHKAAIA